MGAKKERPDSFKSGLLPLNMTGAQWRRYPVGAC